MLPSEDMMIANTSSSLALFLMDAFRFGGRGGGGFVVLLLIGLIFAGVLVWAIQSSGKSTT
jgi:hypothetical protein